MDRIARLDARRDYDAVDELAQLEARSLGIAGRKRFRELLDRVEIDGDSSGMQGDDVRLGCPGEGRLLAIDLGLAEMLIMIGDRTYMSARSRRFDNGVPNAKDVCEIISAPAAKGCAM
jgi:hypothetical protein